MASVGAATQLYVMPPKGHWYCTNSRADSSVSRKAFMNNDRVERYQHMREISKSYLSKLISSERYPDVDPKRVGKLLGLYHHGKMIFESESEISVMMDFAIAEKLYYGKSLVDREIESNQNLNPDRRAILEAFRSGYTSLFEVIGANPPEHTVQLYDLLKDDDKEILDINLSRSITPSRLIFFRILSFDDFAMSSGAGFVYNSKLKDLLLRRYRAGIRTRFVLDKSITRFLIFHKLNREFGEELELV